MVVIGAIQHHKDELKLFGWVKSQVSHISAVTNITGVIFCGTAKVDCQPS